MTTNQMMQGAVEARLDLDSVGEDQISCECMLCDEPEGHDDMPVEWRLIWRFDRLPAVEHGEDIMLLCDHCLHEWLDNPDDFGGDPVRYHAV